MADIILIDGIGPSYKTKLAKLGVGTIEELLAYVAKGPDGVQAIADATGAKPAQVETWVDHADVWRLFGMTEGYYRLLTLEGVTSLGILAKQDAHKLEQAMAARNAKDKVSPMVPDDDLLTAWILAAAKPAAPAQPAKAASAKATPKAQPKPKAEPAAQDAKASAQSQPAAEQAAGSKSADPNPKKAPVNTFQLVLDYAKKAAAAAAIPIPIGDLVAVSEVQHEMVRELAVASNVPFSRAAAAQAIKGLVPVERRVTTLTSAVKIIPLWGMVAGSSSGAFMHAVATYAIGNTLLDHFRRGGNLSNFSAQASKSAFDEHEKMGKQMLSGMLKQKLGLA